MDHGIFSLTSMVITHLVVDDSVLVRHALTLNACFSIVHTGWTRSKQTPLQLTSTRAFQRVKELSFDVCHENANA